MSLLGAFSHVVLGILDFSAHFQDPLIPLGSEKIQFCHELQQLELECTGIDLLHRCLPHYR